MTYVSMSKYVHIHIHEGGIAVKWQSTGGHNQLSSVQYLSNASFLFLLYLLVV